MDELTQSIYTITHEDLAERTGVEIEYLKKKSSEYASVLDKFRIQGPKGIKLYNNDGALVWEQISAWVKSGKKPREIRELLESTYGKEESFKPSSVLKSRRVGEEIKPESVSIYVYEQTRKDLKEVINARDREISKLTHDLDDYKKSLPAPTEWQRSNEEKSEARREAANLLRELDELEKKGYWWVSKTDRKRKEELIRKLSDLNFKH